MNRNKATSDAQSGADFEERFAPGDILRHFKRDAHGEGTRFLYAYLGIAWHSETMEPLAVYRALYGEGRLFARPAPMFFSPVDREKHPEARQAFRFEKALPEDLEALAREGRPLPDGQPGGAKSVAPQARPVPGRQARRP